MFESGSGSYAKGNDEFSFDNSFLAGGWVKKNLEYYSKKTKTVAKRPQIGDLRTHNNMLQL